MSLFSKLVSGLQKTRQNISNKVDSVLNSFKKIDIELFEELEDVLISSDIGIELSTKIIENLKVQVLKEKVSEPLPIKQMLKNELLSLLHYNAENIKLKPSPLVILMVGVNGVGKTTSIVKIANLLQNQHKKVIIAAADTFRAAAIEQLETWADRIGVDVIKHFTGSDPAAVVFDAIQAAKARQADVLICDTAGRLHTKKNLMNELGKMSKIINREFPEANLEILLVIDATTGQNALSQAKAFNELTQITGIILTKLDGTAKGGMIASLKYELDIPVKLIGVGEKIDDLQLFDAKQFVEAMFN